MPKVLKLAIDTAEHFWIEAGAMSGPPAHRHQIELPNDLAEFFDDDSRDDEEVPLRLAGQPIHWRPLTYRGTDYGQWTDIWRLGLLTPRMGGPKYAQRVVMFTRVVERTNQGWLTFYELQVANASSAQATRWRATSTKLGTTGGHAGRDYGWF